MDRDLVVRPATLEDARLLFDWRNDPVTRAMSRDTAEIAWESHVAWLDRALRRRDLRIHIVEQEGEPVATIRFDYGEEVEFSWNVAPARRGTGLAAKVAALMLEMEPAMVGYIRPENVAAKRICARAGMARIASGEFEKWAAPGTKGAA
ncbi:GNAT family N-acetyltransferase [Sphingomicrobium aestuariivivum]|uniref:GNAT family N-acetyltransferase n=1 Tax=Sphingomicrobium aestuariivivum TaxID=1582356 RepID=UPI001FD644B1|nr:GNAT family N-acetyltransferase [Sphingomicrobium aestuariivivum]MCJ8190777.1 GNAT family N-acetyltransferase [Sphingomicrobium aestuariivivum]